MVGDKGNNLAPMRVASNSAQFCYSLRAPGIVIASIDFLDGADSYTLASFGIMVIVHNGVIYLEEQVTNETAVIKGSYLIYDLNNTAVIASVSSQNSYYESVTNISGTVVVALISPDVNATTAPQILLDYPYLFILTDYYPYPLSGVNTNTWSGSSYISDNPLGDNEEWQQWLSVSQAYTSSGVVSGEARGTFEAPYSYGGWSLSKVGFTFEDTKGFIFNGQVLGGNKSTYVGIQTGDWEWSYWNVPYTNSGTTLTLCGGYFYRDSTSPGSIQLMVSLNNSLTIPSGE
ncbi:MAG: hypothetical protein M1351_04145 [Candidatus Thermoplasmatota archaeon]|nr:hypothetical protein [Candidatus Thermoplasmatota archaeon]